MMILVQHVVLRTVVAMLSGPVEGRTPRQPVGGGEELIGVALGLRARAVQRSIHDAHGEDCTDAAEGDAMPTI
jgi:hypothetical protein